jgi:hypothetical protein
VAPGWLDPCVLGRYLPGVANDVFNGMDVVASYRLATSCAYVTRRRVVGLPNTVAVHHEWAASRRYTVAACYEWPADRRCPVAVLQTPCPYILLAFNVPPAACLACTRYRPCHVASWKLRPRDTWARMSTRLALRFDLELIHGGNWSVGYRQWPPGPPQERLRTHRWGQLFDAPLGYLKLFTW